MYPPAPAWTEDQPRFEVCFQLRSIKHRHRIRLKIAVPEHDPRVRRSRSCGPAFNWQERETFDMYGIKFDGHPDLRRIYLYEEFVGHPLRKDYPKEKRQPLVRRDDLPINPIKRRRSIGSLIRAATRQLVLGRKDVQDLGDTEAEMPHDLMTVNMGPSHPAMHGTVRMVLTLDGERVRAADIELGYMHRCFEKESEHATYSQAFPYTDRLNYVSPMINNVGWAMTVEKLMGLTKQDPQARGVHPRHRQRAVAHHRPPHVYWRLGDGARRVHAVPVLPEGARVALRATREGSPARG